MLRLVEESGSPGIRLVICTHLESDAKIVYQVCIVIVFICITQLLTG